jgi:hypothetical protein
VARPDSRSPSDPANAPAIPGGSRARDPIVDLDFDGRTVCSVRPPGELRFDVPVGARAMSGQFGIHPRSYATGARASARFTIESVSPEGRIHIFFDRVLDPASREDDRGFQRFSVPLPGDLYDELVLRTSEVLGADPDRTWCFWCDLKFSADPPADGQH